MTTTANPPTSRTRFGIRAKLLVALTIFNVIVTAVFTANQHRTERERILGGIESKLRAAATALPLILPDGYLDRAVTPDAVSEGEYRTIVDRLNAYCAENHLIYLYTYRFADGVFSCTSSNGTPEEMAEGKFTPYFDPYLEAPPSIHEAWDANRPVTEIVTDRWGTVFTLFLPMETAAGTRYIAGADVDIAFVDTLLAGSLRRSLLVGALAFVAIYFLSHYASSRFSRAIQRLSSYTGEFTESNFTAPTDSPLRREVVSLPDRHRDEIGRLAGSFLVMEDRLAAYLRDLTETTAAKERIQNELKLAGQIQADMLPRAFNPGSHRGRVDLQAAMKPAREAGGDLYDYFFIDENHLCVLIGDVSGKGVPAALFMTVAVTVLRANATTARIDKPDTILAEANELLNRNNDSCQFVTLFVGILDLRTGVLTYADGGHNRPYHRPAGGPATMLDIKGGVALGVVPGAPYRAHTLRLNPGDTFFLYTDGVNEAIAADDSFYGDERLRDLLSRMPADAPAREWVDAVMTDVATFARGHEQSDDITLLALRIPAE